MPRLFTAIQLPSEVRQELAALRQPLPSARWIDADNFHISLSFVGDITPPAAREFAANLANIAFDPFPIRLIGLDTFGGNDPRTIFACVKPSEPLADLARANETAARRAGLKPENRKFIPHVTLARLQYPRIDPIARYLAHRGGFRTSPFLVSEFVLYSSKPMTGGGPYVVEQHFSSTFGALDDIEWEDEPADRNERLER